MISSGGRGARPAWGGVPTTEGLLQALQDVQSPRSCWVKLLLRVQAFLSADGHVYLRREDRLQEDCPAAGELPKWGHRAAQVKLRQLEKNSQTRSCWCSMNKGTWVLLLSAREPSLQGSAGAGPASICLTPAPSAPSPRGGGGAVPGGPEGGAAGGFSSAGRKERRPASRRAGR